MKFNCAKHDVEQFEQVLEHFKQVFLPKIEAQLQEIDDIYTTAGKPRVLIPCLKCYFP